MRLPRERVTELVDPNPRCRSRIEQRDPGSFRQYLDDLEDSISISSAQADQGAQQRRRRASICFWKCCSGFVWIRLHRGIVDE